MKTPQCPLCYSSLEKREVAPCADCGHWPEELQHFREGLHRYDEYRVLGDFRLVLCNFCISDFGSYDPAYFGVSPRQWHRLLSRRELIRPIDPLPERTWDDVCADCERRLAWLEFVARSREMHTSPST